MKYVTTSSGKTSNSIFHNVFTEHHVESGRFYLRALCYRSLRKSEKFELLAPRFNDLRRIRSQGQRQY